MPEKKEHGLYRKLAEIMGEIGKVEKRGYNAFHNYHYVREGDLTDVLREKLSTKGIVIIPSLKSVQHDDTLTTAMMTFTFVDSVTGEKHEADWAGEGDDKGDKGLYKAYTGSLKYFLMKMFLISQGDDPEGDTATDKRAETRSSHVQGVACPECKGAMWDNRESKRNPRAPDYKCKNKNCNGALWEDAKEPAPTLDDAAIGALREQIKGAAQALNDAGDLADDGSGPRWTVQSINAMAKEHFGGPVASLGVDVLGQLAEMFSQRLEDTRQTASQRRKDIISSINASAPKEEIDAVLREEYAGRTLEELTTVELHAVDKTVGIPF